MNLRFTIEIESEQESTLRLMVPGYAHDGATHDLVLSQWAEAGEREVYIGVDQLEDLIFILGQARKTLLGER